MSIDGGVYDHISRASMLTALQRRPELAGLLPFAFYRVRAGKTGTMPGFYALGQHAALPELQSRLRPGENLHALLGDVYVTSPPERTLAALQAAQGSLSQRANVQVHWAKRTCGMRHVKPPRLLAAIAPQAMRRCRGFRAGCALDPCSCTGTAEPC